MWILDGYSVVDKTTGEYYVENKPREHCQAMIDSMGWRNAMITRRKRAMTRQEKIAWLEAKRLQDEQRVSLFELQRIDGEKMYYRTLDDVAEVLNVSNTVVRAVFKRKNFAHYGACKDYMIYKIVVPESKANELLEQTFTRLKEYKEVYVVQHRKGTECMFDTLEEARKFLKLSWWKFKALLEEDDYATSGSAEDWRAFTRLVEV